MNEEFAKQTTECIKQFMSDDYEIMNGTVRKNNGVVLHSVSIKNNSEKIAPVFLFRWISRYGARIGSTTNC